MRENIGIFRGKRQDNGEWVEGYLSAACDCTGRAWFIYVPAADPDDINRRYDIDPETVGEFTGLTDKNGKRIFEGDIISYFGRDFLNSEVVFYKNAFMFRFISEYVQKIRQQKYDLIFQNVSICGEVIGNIHDNPELLGGDGDDD